MKESRKSRWWQREIIYQVYPRSFMDSNGDGVGDLPGITRKLDYLHDLGIGAIWISPFYPSPMADFGYDVSDYTGIHPLFGEMKDIEELLEGIHRRGMKLILDFVPNHTSEEHPWFIESRSSRDNPRRDWYIWKDPAPDGGPPNNWLSEFGGGGWELDEVTGQYYYHAYLKEQPDLNWRNPEVQKAMFEIMRFWLRKGVDGFRVDVMWHMIKDSRFRDNPPNPEFSEDMSPYRKLLPVYSSDQPEVHEVVRKMRNVVKEFSERLLIGEIYLPVDRLVMYYGEENTGAHLPFNFQLIKLPWDAEQLNAAINLYEGALPDEAWPNWVLGNHDKSRIASRVGEKQARIAAMLLLSLRGTPTMYYGDEIGMTDVPISPEQVKDPHEKRVPGKNLGRDPERTPMQWDASANAGFSSETPWLPVMKEFEEVNVAKETEDNHSILSLYRRLIRLRNEENVLQVGDYFPFFCKNDLLSYIRSDGRKSFLIALNFGSSTARLELQNGMKGICRVSTALELEEQKIGSELFLKGNQGVIVELESPYQQEKK